jgi:hypothetical protein
MIGQLMNSQGCNPIEHHPKARHTKDWGAASSLSMVLLTPMFLVVMMLAFQSAMWSHARTEARVRVRDVAGLVARSGLSAAHAEAQVRASMNNDSLLQEFVIEVMDRGDSVAVRLRGRAPGVVRGTSASVDVSTILWREGWQP